MFNYRKRLGYCLIGIVMLSFSVAYVVYHWYWYMLYEDGFDELVLYRALPNESRPVIVEPYIEYSDSIKYSKYTVETFSYDYWLHHKHSRLFPRAMTINQHKLMMNLLERVDQILRAHSLTYILSDGTLIGTYRHHDTTPWDDDLDIWCKASERKKLEKVFESYKSEIILHQVDHTDYKKVHFTQGNKAGKHEWKWPYIDMWFYEENSTHIWTMYYKQVIPLDIIYPLRLRPFGRLYIPVPHDSAQYLDILDFKDLDRTCVRGDYNHVQEKRQWSYKSECFNLYQIYPFVSKTCNKTHCMEDLIVDNVFIHTFVYKK